LAEAEGLTDPLFEYLHDEGNSVVGGYVYRGALLNELEGTYIFGDFNGVREPDDDVATGDSRTQRLLVGDPETGELSSMQIDGRASSAQLPTLIYSFAEDAAGELYVLGGDGKGSGSILKLVAATHIVPGDLDGDGFVGQDDLNLVLGGWGQVRGDWTDINAFLTPEVGQEELNRVLTNWGGGTPPDLAGLPVPEPSAAWVLAGGALFWRRHRQRPDAGR
jgi:hypothetical protein